ncbi:hypothetical protein L873DRAFT_1799584 [Choiromyces venosus 120613-1]|uniref:Uncharacterized protein n=1 Tax=Choiromyces venosus 120613-1 TaxID=1336337 RepID=A0A3N4K0N1_9PEZI|nr:hypothetical protein L873DRAFT_1799584 [Choiromyces venosus 120613-1]
MSLFKKKSLTSPPSPTLPSPTLPPPTPLLRRPSYDTQKPHLSEATLIIDNLLDPSLTNQNVFTLLQILINHYAKTFLKPQDLISEKITDATTKFLDDHNKTRIEYAERKRQHNEILLSIEARKTTWPEIGEVLTYKSLIELSNVEQFFRLKESLGRIQAVEKLIQGRYKALLGVNGIENTQIGQMVAELMRVRAGLGYDICLAAEMGIKVRGLLIRDLMLGNHNGIL